MNLHELPMIFFTVMAQMSVGAFLVLGVIQTFGSLRHDSKTIDRVADPALAAIGPTLVLGAGLLAIFIYGFAKPHSNPKPLMVCVAVALVLVFVGELLGRMQFYEAMVRIGM